MHIFLDFEASSLGDHSYPIEVGWAAEDGACESDLIRPAPAWSDWDPAAEAIHRLTRERLLAEGRPHDEVARRLIEVLSPHEVFVSAPSWDGKWMSVLLRAAGLPRHALRLKDTDEAHRQAVAEILPDLPETELQPLVAELVAEARRHHANAPRHRALADAQAELELWREVRRLAQARIPVRPPAS